MKTRPSGLEVKETADGAIVGPGHLDTLGPAVVGWCAKLEDLGVPAVPLICAIFPDMERQTAVQKGVPLMRITYMQYHVLGCLGRGLAQESGIRRSGERADRYWTKSSTD